MAKKKSKLDELLEGSSKPCIDCFLDLTFQIRDEFGNCSEKEFKKIYDATGLDIQHLLSGLHNFSLKDLCKIADCLNLEFSIKFDKKSGKELEQKRLSKEVEEEIDGVILSLNETITEQRNGLINGNGVRLKLTKIVRKLIKLKKS